MRATLQSKRTHLLSARKWGPSFAERLASSGPPLSRGKQIIGRVRTALLFVALLLHATQQSHAQASSDELLERVVDDVIVPGYADLVQAAVVEQVQWQAFCAVPSADSMAAVRDAYRWLDSATTTGG